MPSKRQIKKGRNRIRYNYGFISHFSSSNSIPMRHRQQRKLFLSWLKESAHRFNHLPQPIQREKSVFHFEGIVHNITLVMQYSAPEATLVFDLQSSSKNDCPVDMRDIEYIGWEHYDEEKGYYDKDRVDEIYTYFPTQAALYKNEVFEAIIKYTNEKFTEENMLYLYRSKGRKHFCSGMIDAKDPANIRVRWLRETLQECREVDSSEVLNPSDYIEIHFCDLFDASKYRVRFFECDE